MHPKAEERAFFGKTDGLLYLLINLILESSDRGPSGESPSLGKEITELPDRIPIGRCSSTSSLVR